MEGGGVVGGEALDFVAADFLDAGFENGNGAGEVGLLGGEFGMGGRGSGGHRWGEDGILSICGEGGDL